MNLSALLAATIAHLEQAAVGAEALDLGYVDRWVAALGLEAAWSRAQALRSAGSSRG